MTKVSKHFFSFGMALDASHPDGAQRFFNLTSPEVRVDSVLPQFVCSYPCRGYIKTPVYSVEVKYPEYVDMTPADIANYNRLSGAALPQQVSISQEVVTCRKQAMLRVSFSPLVFRNNRYQILVSFMLDVKAHALSRSQRKARQDMSMSRTADAPSMPPIPCLPVASGLRLG